MRHVRTALLVASGLVLPTIASAQSSATVDSARTLLAKYRDPVVAAANGYLSTTACMAFSNGAMGIHFINMGTVGQPLDPAKPQVLMYEPVGDSLRLIAAEWFVPASEQVTAAPVLFGEHFDGPMDGHPPIMPTSLRHYDLHVWLWKQNPAGMFNPVNPSVNCGKYPYSHTERTAVTRAHGH